MEVNKLIQGDCLEVMKTFPEASFDGIFTDPPYGYNFMGKDWDKAVPSVDLWKECLRVLKPGAFAFVMSAPRADVQAEMIKRLDAAGFEVAFTPIYWTYASGFPKATNIGKLVDKRMGMKREIVQTRLQPDITKNSYNKPNRNGTKEIHDSLPASKEAKALEGSYAGFQPKPAVEVILVVMKPLSEKTYVEQAVKTGKGVTWLDDCKIPTSQSTVRPLGKSAFQRHSGIITNGQDGIYDVQSEQSGSDTGRFPANLLVSDDVLNDGKEHSSGDLTGQKNAISSSGKFGTYNIRENHWKGDSGSFSRYFSLDAWWSERVKKLSKEMKDVFPFMIVPKATKGEKKTKNGIACDHPTVKPIQLMSYLLTLGSREGELILDCFAGSGSTLIAALMNQRRYVGIELNPEYIKIAQNRLSKYPNTKINDFSGD